MLGRYCCVEPLDIPSHAAEMYQANSQDTQGKTEPICRSIRQRFPFLLRMAAESERQSRPQFHAIIDLAGGKAIGVAALMPPWKC